MKFTSNRPLWLLCASVVQDSCKKPKWHHHSRYQMEELWIWAVGFKWRHRNPSRVHLMTTPLGNQLSFRTFCWLQIALLFPYYWRAGLPPSTTSRTAHHSWKSECSSARHTSFGKTYFMSSQCPFRKCKMHLLKIHLLRLDHKDAGCLSHLAVHLNVHYLKKHFEDYFVPLSL